MINFQIRAFLILAFCTFTFSDVSAAEPLVWSVNSAADALRGEAIGVSIDKNGRITAAPAVNEIASAGQPYVWAAALDPQGNVYLATGPEGLLFKVTKDGKSSVFADFDEINVSAIAVARNGDIFVSTSPDGKVYKTDPTGKFSVYFEPGEKYIWALAVLPDGSLAVGTGDQGKIYRVQSAGAKPSASLLYDSSEMHIISLAIDRSGDLLAGTDPGGIVLRIQRDGKAFALLDSPLREVHKIAVGSDGSVYALLLGDSVSAAKPAEPAATASPATITVEKPNPMQPPPPRRSKYDLNGAKSAVYKIRPGGGDTIIWSSQSISAFSIETGQGIVYIGTTDRGRIYSVNDTGDETLLVQTEEGQISRLIRSQRELFAAASNPGKLYKIGSESVPTGEYRSPVLDAKSAASWGSISWTSSGSVRIETRVGNTEKPDETWTAWEPVRSESPRGSIAGSPTRYMQWRAILTGPSASLSEVNVLFLPQNIAPEITSVQILPANVGLLANPPIQIDPNIALAGLDPAVFGIVVAAQPPRRVYLRGARGFLWTAEDRNGDKLEYDIYIREISEKDFVQISKGLSENFYSLDGLALRDGRYVLRIVVRDTPSNPVNTALYGEFQTEPFYVDNSPPVITVNPAIKSKPLTITFSATDKTSYIARAEYSIDGGDWQSIAPADGIADSPEENFVLELPIMAAGTHLITLRVFDSSGNIATASETVRIN